MKYMEYIELIPISKAKEILLNNLANHNGEGDTINTTALKLLNVGLYGSFTIVARATTGFNSKVVRWDGGYISEGSHNRIGERTSIEEVVNHGINAAKQWYENFNRELEEEDKRRKNVQG